jgi:hypothetical protein
LKLPRRNQVWRECYESLLEARRVNTFFASEVAFAFYTG